MPSLACSVSSGRQALNHSRRFALRLHFCLKGDLAFQGRRRLSAGFRGPAPVPPQRPAVRKHSVGRGLQNGAETETSAAHVPCIKWPSISRFLPYTVLYVISGLLSILTTAYMLPCK